MKTNKTQSQYDKMTRTPINRLILSLSVPAIISMLITNVYNLVDTAFVGTLGTSASGAIGIVFGFMSIVQAVGFLFGQGAGSILSRALGEKNKEKASINASVGFFSSMLFGLIISVIGLVFIDEVVMLLGSTVTIAPFAKTYVTYILIATPFMSSGLTMNNLLRYEGKAALGMVGLMTGAVLNMAGDPILMFGLNMGIAGAGVSTALSQFISWMILLSFFCVGKTESRISLRFALKAKPAVFAEIFTTGFPSLLRQALNSLATVLLNAQCSVYGDAAVAAMSIVSRIFFFAFSVALGIGQGYQPVAAFNYGAKKFKRLRDGYRFTLTLNQGIIIFAGILLCVFANELVALFRDDPEVIRIGAHALRLQSIAGFALPVCMTTEMLMQSTGKRLGATLMSSLRSGLLFIPMLYIFTALRGLSGIQEAQPASLVLSLPVSIAFAVIYFKRLAQEEAAFNSKIE